MQEMSLIKFLDSSLAFRRSSGQISGRWSVNRWVEKGITLWSLLLPRTVSCDGVSPACRQPLWQLTFFRRTNKAATQPTVMYAIRNPSHQLHSMHSPSDVFDYSSKKKRRLIGWNVSVARPKGATPL
mmetsp:Transcript_40604/g.60206  ORF Transcript_40604/g.60206 Transcript_40604/m.60206 type:complete len:127 (+) Transcript_40604:403-783(+)